MQCNNIIFLRMLHTVHTAYVGYGVQVPNVGMCTFVLMSMEVVCVCVCVRAHMTVGFVYTIRLVTFLFYFLTESYTDFLPSVLYPV